MKDYTTLATAHPNNHLPGDILVMPKEEYRWWAHVLFNLGLRKKSTVTVLKSYAVAQVDSPTQITITPL